MTFQPSLSISWQGINFKVNKLYSLIIINIIILIIVVRAIYGLSVAVFGFVQAVIVFEILSIMCANDSFPPKMGHFAKKRAISHKL